MPLFKTGRSEEKEVDVVLGEVACFQIERPTFSLQSFVLQNHCANFSKYSFPLMLKPKSNFSNLNGPKKRR